MDMDFWDLVPFIVGAIYLFSKGKGKSTPQPAPEETPKRSKSTSSEPSFEEVLRELMGEKNKQPEVVVETPRKTQTVYPMDVPSDRRSYESPVKKKKEKTVRIENPDTHTWSYDDHIEDELVEKKRVHREFDRHMEVEEIGLKADEIDFRNAVIYDAIFHRPEH